MARVNTATPGRPAGLANGKGAQQVADETGAGGGPASCGRPVVAGAQFVGRAARIGRAGAREWARAADVNAPSRERVMGAVMSVRARLLGIVVIGGGGGAAATTNWPGGC